MCTQTEPCDEIVEILTAHHIKESDWPDTPLTRAAFRPVAAERIRMVLHHFVESGACGHMARRIAPPVIATLAIFN